jgi:hypothetical protein
MLTSLRKILNISYLDGLSAEDEDLHWEINSLKGEWDYAG